jgi:WD40 repeat protein
VGTETLNPENGGIFVLSADQRHLAISFDDEVGVFQNDETALQNVALLQVDGVYSMQFQDNVLWIGGADQRVTRWGLDPPRRLTQILQPSLVRSFAVSPNGDELTVGTRDRHVEHWCPENWGREPTTPATVTYFPPLAVSSDGEVAMSTTVDGVERIQVWRPDVDTKKLLWPVVSSASANRTATALGISPDGRFIASINGDGLVHLMDRETGEPPMELVEHDDWGMSLVFAPRRQQFATCGSNHEVFVWDSQTGRLIHKLQHDLKPATRMACALAYSPDGNHLAVGSGKGHYGVGHVRVWDLTKVPPQPVKNMPVPETVRAIAYSPNGKYLAFTSKFSAGVVQVLDTTNYQRVFEIPAHANKVTTLTFSHDNTRLITGGDDSFVRFLELDEGRCVGSLQADGWIRNVKVFTDGSGLVTYSRDGFVRVWPTSTKRSGTPK